MKAISVILFSLLVNVAYGQQDTVRIHTSAVCETCKEAIEHDLSFVKGVISSELTVENHMVQVIFDPSKITAESIKKEITNIGYDADSLKANPKAFRKLPECCKKPHNE